MSQTDTPTRADWRQHVKRTPIGFVPVLVNGWIPSYLVAMGRRYTREGIVAHFTRVAAPRFWPKWVREMGVVKSDTQHSHPSQYDIALVGCPACDAARGV